MIGAIQSVERRVLQTQMAAAASSGATVLTVTSTEYFGSAGSLSLNGVTYAYTSKTESTLTLAAGLTGAAVVDDLVAPLDAQGQQQERWVCWTDLGDEGDPAPAQVPTAMIAHLIEGNANAGQAVSLTESDDVLIVDSRPTQVPVLDGQTFQTAESGRRVVIRNDLSVLGGGLVEFFTGNAAETTASRLQSFDSAGIVGLVLLSGASSVAPATAGIYVTSGTVGNTQVLVTADYTALTGRVDVGSMKSAGDVEITDATKGVILRSPNGSRWRVTVDNAGNLVRTSI